MNSKMIRYSDLPNQIQQMRHSMYTRFINRLKTTLLALKYHNFCEEYSTGSAKEVSASKKGSLVEENGTVSFVAEIVDQLKTGDSEKDEWLLTAYTESIDAIYDQFIKGFGLKLRLVNKTDRLIVTITFPQDLTQSIIKFINRDKANEGQQTSSITESADLPSKIHVDSKVAKESLASIGKSIIERRQKDKSFRVTQSIANTICNIISRAFLPRWSEGYSDLSITLTTYSSPMSVEFITPRIDKHFIERFIEGREQINGLLHQSRTIKMKMNPKILYGIKKPDDIYRFFQNAIKYYSHGISKLADKVAHEMIRLPKEIKYLVRTTNLHSLVSTPLTFLFTFDNVSLSKNPFRIKNTDIIAIRSFLKNIYSRYGSPEREKVSILKDMKSLIKSFKEDYNDSYMNGNMSIFVEAIGLYLNNQFDKDIEAYHESYAIDNIEVSNKNKPYMEFFGPKRLKKISRDIIPYIQIEAETINSAADKLMIAQYTVTKLDLIDWYINIIDVGSKKYIVPHTKQYLLAMKTELLKCYKFIMGVKVNQDRSLTSRIPWPKGYEG